MLLLFYFCLMKFLENNDFKNKRVLVRVDFNVPLNEDRSVSDESRIVAAIPTINYVLSKNGIVILLSHLGRPKGNDKAFSLLPIAKKLSKLLQRPVEFLNDCIGDEVEKKLEQSKSGEIYLLENLRFYKEETNGDRVFSEKLSRLGDVYINDAFGASHRAQQRLTGAATPHLYTFRSLQHGTIYGEALLPRRSLHQRWPLCYRNHLHLC